MARLETYKCPNCGGAVEFDATSQKLVCPYCDTEFDIEAVKEFDNKQETDQAPENMQWDTYNAESGNGDWTQEEASNMKAYSCQSCGGEIITDSQTAATSCPYCGNPVIIPIQFEGVFKPDFVIPFAVTKAGAKGALANFVKNKKLLPSIFKQENRIEEITGMYVPYWMFNCDADADMQYKGTKTRRWSDSKYNYTKTDYYNLLRAGDLKFYKLPVDGSSKLANNYTEAIEPYDYTKLIEFTPEYLAGFVADKYDVSAEECALRANERIRVSTKNAFSRTTSGYSTVPVSEKINIKQGEVNYAMLPVWILNTKYKNKIYTFAMNGQTGKFVGELPIDWKKFWLYALSIFGGMSVLMTLIYLIGLGGNL